MTFSTCKRLCWRCSGHVLSEDTTSRNIVTGCLHTKRLLTKTNHVPRWGERFIPGPRQVCIIEESVIDPKTQTLTTYTRNIGYTTIMVTFACCLVLNSVFYLASLYPTMLSISLVFAVVRCLSVCLSVTISYCSQRLNLSSYFFHHLVAPKSCFF